jgi:hypothetical protein
MNAVSDNPIQLSVRISRNFSGQVRCVEWTVPLLFWLKLIALETVVVAARAAEHVREALTVRTEGPCVDDVRSVEC